MNHKQSYSFYYFLSFLILDRILFLSHIYKEKYFILLDMVGCLISALYLLTKSFIYKNKYE